MERVRVTAVVRARWSNAEVGKRLSSAQDLAGFAVELLVRDLGADGARAFLREEIAAYIGAEPELAGGGDDARE